VVSDVLLVMLSVLPLVVRFDVLFAEVVFVDKLFVEVLFADVLFIEVLFVEVLFADVLFIDVLFIDVLFVDVFVPSVPVPETVAVLSVVPDMLVPLVPLTLVVFCAPVVRFAEVSTVLVPVLLPLMLWVLPCMVVDPVAFIVAWSPVLGVVSLGLVSVPLDAMVESVVIVVSAVSAVSVEAQLTRAMHKMERAIKGVRFMMF
jgi:hypothetical protein